MNAEQYMSAPSDQIFSYIYADVHGSIKSSPCLSIAGYPNNNDGSENQLCSVC